MGQQATYDLMALGFDERMTFLTAVSREQTSDQNPSCSIPTATASLRTAFGPTEANGEAFESRLQPLQAWERLSSL